MLTVRLNVTHRNNTDCMDDTFTHTTGSGEPELRQDSVCSFQTQILFVHIFVLVPSRYIVLSVMYYNILPTQIQYEYVRCLLFFALSKEGTICQNQTAVKLNLKQRAANHRSYRSLIPTVAPLANQLKLTCNSQFRLILSRGANEDEAAARDTPASVDTCRTV